jgi:hypothetical protein
VGVYTSNDLPTIIGPFANTLYNGNSGSSAGHAGYQIQPSAGIGIHTWTVTAPAGDNNVLAAFTPAVATPTNTFAKWIANPDFGLAAADQGFHDDPDGDGIPNGLENFFGTHPGEFSQGLVAGRANPLAGTFTFTHPQNASPPSELSASYRWSTDLAAFHLGGETSGGTTVNFTTEANTPSPGFTRVTATVTGTLPDRQFFDVEVTGP